MLYFIAPYNRDTNTDHKHRMALLRFLERHHILYDLYRLTKCGEGYYGVMVKDIPKAVEDYILSQKFFLIKTDKYPLKVVSSALAYVEKNDNIYEFEECQ